MSKSNLWSKNYVTMLFVNFFIFLGFLLLPTVLPAYLKSLGAADSALGWLQGIMTIAALVVRPFAGLALDKYGRKGIFLSGLIGMMITTSMYYFFPYVTIIFAIRSLNGMMWGITNTAANTVVSDNIHKEHFAEGMSFFNLANGLGLLLAPAIALSLDIKQNFILAVVFFMVAFVLASTLKYTKPEQPKVKQENNKKKNLYAKEAIAPAFIMSLFSVAYGAVLSFMALYATQRGIDNIGLFFTVYALGMISVRPFIGKLIESKGYGVGLWPAVILVPSALVIISLSTTLISFIIGGALLGVGIACAQSSLQTIAVINVSADQRGSANATFLTGFDGGIGIGSIISGLIASSFGYASMYGMLAILPICGGILYFIYVQKIK